MSKKVKLGDEWVDPDTGATWVCVNAKPGESTGWTQQSLVVGAGGLRAVPG
jgi:hypothetical protein